MLHKLGAKHVVATDGNPEVLELTQSNIQSNTKTNNNTNNNMNNKIETDVLSWGLLNSIDYSEIADIVVGSDLTYNSGSWRVLAETMHTILKPNGVVVYLSLGHDGFNVRSEIDGFLSVAKEIGLLVLPELEIKTTTTHSTTHCTTH